MTAHSPDDVRRLLERHGAIQSGHFLLSSGLHSPHYVQCALVLQHPEVAAEVCARLADRFRAEEVQTVIGPAIGAITLAYEVARQLGARAIWAERTDGRMSLRRSFSLSAGERVLVVEDVITTGGSAKEVVHLAGSFGAHVVGVGAIVDRSGGTQGFLVRFEPLLRLDVTTYPPSSCPLCDMGIPLAKPGSRRSVASSPVP